MSNCELRVSLGSDQVSLIIWQQERAIPSAQALLQLDKVSQAAKARVSVGDTQSRCGDWAIWWSLLQSLPQKHWKVWTREGTLSVSQL